MSGFCARGGFEVSIDWKDGALVFAKIKSRLGGKLALVYGDKQITVDTQAGDVLTFDVNLQLID